MTDDVESEAPPSDEGDLRDSSSFGGGYCRPPKEQQFKPGQSGNPRGRPRKRRLARDELTPLEVMRRMAHMPVPMADGRRRHVPYIEALTRQLAVEGLKDPRFGLKLLGHLVAAMDQEKPLARQTDQAAENAILEDHVEREARRLLRRRGLEHLIEDPNARGSGDVANMEGTDLDARSASSAEALHREEPQ